MRLFPFPRKKKAEALTPQQNKQIQAAIHKRKPTGPPRTAQQSIPFQQDGFDDVRAEYSQMLCQQLAKGNNGLTKTKFITFGIEADSMKLAKPRLEHVQNDLLNNFHRLGVTGRFSPSSSTFRPTRCPM